MAASGKTRPRARIGESRAVRRTLIAATVAFALLVLVLPLAVIFVQAFSAGAAAFGAAIVHPDTLHAIGLTLLTALIAVPVNTLFGIAAAWAVTKFDFPLKRLLVIAIEIPFSVSPIVAGVAYLFVYGLQGLLGPWLQDSGLQILFALPGIVLASMFVTAPFVARELIPLMQAQGRDLEEAATSLGAGGLRTFLKVTLPNIRWALLYGVVLCNARVMGEFGAVSVVSGNIRGQTNTLPLHVELLYHDYDTAGAFAAAAVLTVLALVTLALKVWLEGRGAGRRLQSGPRPGPAVPAIVPPGETVR